MQPGEVVYRFGRAIRFDRLIQRELPDKYVVEAELAVSQRGQRSFRLFPAQHLHRLQNQWTTEVAIQSTWSNDLYAILQSGESATRFD